MNIAGILTETCVMVTHTQRTRLAVKPCIQKHTYFIYFCLNYTSRNSEKYRYSQVLGHGLLLFQDQVCLRVEKYPQDVKL